MDFDKIKKAAKDTIKMVSNKVEEKLSASDDDMIEVKPEKFANDDFDDFSQNDDMMGTTQRFDMKDALNRFRHQKNDIKETLSDLIKNNDADDTDECKVNEFIESNLSDLKKDISESISDIDSDISDLSMNYSREMAKIDKELSQLKEDVAKITQAATKSDNALATLSYNLESSIMDSNKKLGDISSLLSGVNKINDSIFDLKNSQVNTKNFLGDLEASFRNLKKKMTAGITILSVISAIVAVLEVINLLS